jgi:hypothetical protein
MQPLKFVSQFYTRWNPQSRRAWSVFVAVLSGLVLGNAMLISAQEKTMNLPTLGERLTTAQVNAFADLALKNLDQEFPNKPSVVYENAAAIVTPKELFPAFFGSFDWHSSVHGHWMLVRLLKEYPGFDRESDVREILSRHLTQANIEHEAKLFSSKENKSFERMYGWAWFLRLVSELNSWNDTDAQSWRNNLRPLEEVFVANAIEYLPKLTYPIRTGEHPDTGFALGQLIDYAREVGNSELENLCCIRAIDFYGDDTDYPTRYEPSGHDFFSPCWNEADTMRRVLPQEKFVKWFDRYLPELIRGEGGNLLRPVEVSDVTDGKLVHLAGLDLSRAWCLHGIAMALPAEDPRRDLLILSSKEHGRVGMGYVFSGHYEGEHWLATFAIYWITEIAITAPSSPNE